jgi:hypothetical protein
MGAIASTVTAGPVFGRVQSGAARVEYLQDFRPFLSLVEGTQYRQAGPFPTARPATTETNYIATALHGWGVRPPKQDI